MKIGMSRLFGGYYFATYYKDIHRMNVNNLVAILTRLLLHAHGYISKEQCSTQ